MHFLSLEPGALDTLPLEALQPLLAPVYGTCLSSISVGLAYGKAQGHCVGHKSTVL